jgi:hypothetical protein
MAGTIFLLPFSFVSSLGNQDILRLIGPSVTQIGKRKTLGSSPPYGQVEVC